MSAKQVLLTLKTMGTAQNVKVYKRHGAGDNLFGVSFANLNKLKRSIKVDHELAEQLWKTGNIDAMSLAVMIADPARFSASSADRWLKDISYYLLADLFGSLIAKSDWALSRFKKWSASKKEYTKQCGYVVLCGLLINKPELASHELCKRTLKTIAKGIDDAPNRARHAMNSALISIGIYKPSLRKLAISTAGRIGKVEVNHGETSCKTPDAVAYIRKGAAHYDSKKNNRRPRTGVC